jgi:hypothetical protein
MTSNFFVTHQWVRELRRFNAGRLWGAYFWINDVEKVLFGHYNHRPVEVQASEVAGLLATSDEMGFEVIVPRRIDHSEIRKTRPLPQIVGWRYFPKAKGSRPCGCPSCQYGMYGSRKLQAAYAE